jgi:hypothetical protein
MSTPGAPAAPVSAITPTTAEHERLADRESWDLWGPYLSERAWGTVREDYSADGNAWGWFPYDHARSRAYRWNEDGMAGISDRNQDLCLALALWNGQDDHLKERMFGLSGPEGNHGEDAKDYWWYVDATPSHSWLHWRYHYPQGAFPYQQLREENARRGKEVGEYELLDTGIFDEGRFFAVEVQYAKASGTDIVMRIAVTNHGPQAAPIHVLPTLWCRDTWTGRDVPVEPSMALEAGRIVARHPRAGTYRLTPQQATDAIAPVALFCDNRTNAPRVWGGEPLTAFPKDGINDHVVGGAATVNPEQVGTKAAWWFQAEVAPGATVEFVLRLDDASTDAVPDPAVDRVLGIRRAEADAFYAALTPPACSADEARVLREAFAGMIWGKQFFHFNVRRWQDGDPGQMAPPSSRRDGRNRTWRHLHARDVISMPDPWEYPWFAAWDLAFHTVVLAHVDPGFAKAQLELLVREWYQHPNGAIPAYEWNFSDLNPPVHAWAALRVFEIDGGWDLDFLETLFPKLLINFTWWVNQQDADGNSVFGGGFLGLDNIGPIDRSHLPGGYTLHQADGTAWMAFFCAQMLAVLNQLASRNRRYDRILTTFLQHFASISEAITTTGLWDEEAGFFFDQLERPDGRQEPLRVTSLVGAIPLVATATVRLTPEQTKHVRGVARQILGDMFERLGMTPAGLGTGGDNLLDFAEDLSALSLSMVDGTTLRRGLRPLLDEAEMLSPHGIRSLSKRHAAEPFRVVAGGQEWHIAYEPGESTTGMYGGNSNWRGPVWLPINHLVIGALEEHHANYGDAFTVEHPTGSGQQRTLAEVAQDLRERLIALFVPGVDGTVPSAGRPGAGTRLQVDPAWAGHTLFYEYFDGDHGAGLGASHQTGWTGLVADLIIRARG